MNDTETEAETLERLEAALRRIGELARLPKTAGAHAGEVPAGADLAGEAPAGAAIDRGALLHALDLLITRLRNGLELPKPGPVD
jgi:hypothetical protein